MSFPGEPVVVGFVCTYFIMFGKQSDGNRSMGWRIGMNGTNNG